MKKTFIRWLLRLLGAPAPVRPEFVFYALVTPGQRVADVTTNRFKARAIAKSMRLAGDVVTVWKCAPIEEEIMHAD